MSEWIKCEDEMPDPYVECLIWPVPDFGIEIHVATYNPSGVSRQKNQPGWYVDTYLQNFGNESKMVSVTHWMPLPSPPKD